MSRSERHDARPGVGGPSPVRGASVNEEPTVRISLLHATHRAGRRAVDVRDSWLTTAARPDLLEHVIAHDADDEVSCAEPEIARFPALPPTGRVTAVRNWNWAASHASGDLLMVIADDLTPAAPGWDDELRALCGRLDPRAVPFVVKVCDSDRRDEHLMRHPVVSRAYWQRHGLFDDGYYGIGADNDFTLSAHLAGLVLDGRDIVLRHEHPTRGAEATASHRRMSGADELAHGKDRFQRRWPTWRRRVVYRYFSPRAHQRHVWFVRRMARGLIARVGWASVLVPSTARQRLRRLIERAS